MASYLRWMRFRWVGLPLVAVLGHAVGAAQTSGFTTGFTATASNSSPSSPSFGGNAASTNSFSAARPAPRTLTPEMRGDIYMARKMYREAIEKFREAPESPQMENKIGIAFHQLSQIKLAKRSYEKAIKMDRRFPQALNNLGTVYYGEKRYGKSMKYYRKALKITPEAASIWVNLGSAYFARHDVKHAAQCYDTALNIDPLVFEHRSQVGTMLEDHNVGDMALFHFYLAKAFAQRGDNERAISYLRKSLEEGLKERAKLPSVPEFAKLKTEPAFLDLLARDPKPL